MGQRIMRAATRSYVPLSFYSRVPFQVRSIECKRQGVKEVKEGQSATFAVRSLNRRVALRRSTFRKVCFSFDILGQKPAHLDVYQTVASCRRIVGWVVAGFTSFCAVFACVMPFHHTGSCLRRP